MSLERLEALREDMKKCVRCSLCKLVPLPTIRQTRFTSCCPPVDEYHFHAYSGGGMQVMALSLLDGRIQADHDLAQIVSACTTCGACDVACKFIMPAERHEVIIALKEHLAESGLAPALTLSPAASPPPLRLNAALGDLEPLLPHWAEGLMLKILPATKCDVLLMAGAGANRDPEHAATARRLAKLLEAARVDFGILRDEPEIGIDAYWTGHTEVLAEQAPQVVDRLDASGAKTIVTLCGEDLGMLRAKYPRFSYTPQAKVLHASEFLLSLIQQDKLRLKEPVNRNVTYHDPCYLGRQSEPPAAWRGQELRTHGVMRCSTPPKPINYGSNGVFDAPRRLLAAIPGLQFVEMHRVREYAYCCGGGGGVPDSHPTVARAAAQQRVAEASAVGADTLVTACQHCRRNLTRWQDGPGTMVVDLVDMVYAAAAWEVAS
ncbi:MAG: (Fe-S)-binding protein [Nitrososphaerales archaeon]